jgi:hypothetical protein
MTRFNKSRSAIKLGTVNYNSGGDDRSRAQSSVFEHWCRIGADMPEGDGRGDCREWPRSSDLLLFAALIALRSFCLSVFAGDAFFWPM